ncbi:conserved hypothetical protein [Coraliomargarita akajimensis DSM 45221]|uniref:Uncharacterized protein n=2 Tax=Coraliomargarita TaxID=442430 RepID=D5EQ05_CORAD|nr:conserved hypothetical protein [Coraliomargarita akajimensis DSM 45221]
MKSMQQALVLFLCFVSLVSWASARPQFDQATDLLLAQFDSKPDPDDIHAQAALGCMLVHPEYTGVQYYAVSGAYGIQNGPYLDSSTLFAMAFGEQWTDAHKDWDGSVARITAKVLSILQAGGKVWVQEAGQSNITADWIAEVLKTVPAETVKAKVIVVQHSQWNEDQTAPEDLSYVKAKASYFALDDGNAAWDADWGNRGPYSTPEYRSKDTKYMAQAKASPNATAKKLWTEAFRIIDKYYPDGYPHEWSYIHFGGVDYSDCVENWWILEDRIESPDTDGFWKKYVINE